MTATESVARSLRGIGVTLRLGHQDADSGVGGALADLRLCQLGPVSDRNTLGNRFRGVLRSATLLSNACNDCKNAGRICNYCFSGFVTST